MIRQSKPVAPKHLKEATRKWWLLVLEEYELEEHHVRLLTLAGESWDRCQLAREALADLGMVYNDRFGQPHARPEVAIERDCKVSFARLIRELALDISEPNETRHPPTIRGNAAQRTR